MNQPIEITLHLGAHKTASSHLQRSILDHEEALITFGTRVYGPPHFRNRGRSIPTLFGLRPWGNRKLTRREPEDQLRFMAKGDPRVFLTEENFLGPLLNAEGGLSLPLYGEAALRIQALADAVPDAKLRVALAIREPHSFLGSAYSQALFAGRISQPDEFIAANAPTDVDWLRVCGEIAGVAGLAELIVWRYEDYGQLFPTIVDDILGQGARNIVQAHPKALHTGLSRDAHQRVMELAGNDVENLAMTARHDLPVGPANPPFRLFEQPDTSAYQRQVEAIRALPNVRFLEP